MRILDQPTTAEELKKVAAERFCDLVKAVVDVHRELVAIDAELHSDLEALLIQSGSEQRSLWGVNFYPDLHGDDFVEFDSIVNVRPSQGNKSLGVENEETRRKIIQVVNKWVNPAPRLHKHGE